MLHMFLFKGINGQSWVHIWRNAFSLGIQKVTRAGGSTTLKPRRSLSVKGQILMNDILIVRIAQ